MKKNTILFASCISAIGLAFWGCSHNSSDQVTPKSSSTDVKVVDGRLSFNSLSHLKAFMKANETVDYSEVVNKYKTMGFSSYYMKSRFATNNLRVESDSTISIIDTTYIPDIGLANILNEKREIQMGNDSIYRVGSDYTFFCPKGSISLIDDFYTDIKNGSVSVPDDSLYTYKGVLNVYKTVQNVTKSIIVDSSALNAGGRLESYPSYPFDVYFSSDVKMHCELYTSNYFFYSSCGVKTDMLKNKLHLTFFGLIKWWTWDSENATRIGVSGDAYFDLLIRCPKGYSCATGSPVYVSPFTVSTPNNSEGFKRYNEIYGFRVPGFVITQARTTHTCTYNGVTKSAYSEGNTW